MLVRVQPSEPFYMSFDKEKQKGRGVALNEWYRGDTINYYPKKVHLLDPDALYQYILKGLVPKMPFITKEDFITSFGSCFADYLRHHLIDLGYQTHDYVSKKIPIVYVGEGINNTYSLVEQFKWAYGEVDISGEHWIDRDREYYIPTEEHRIKTREAFDKTTVFIFTLGLSEVWYNKTTGEVFWRGVPKEQFDPDIHGFKLTTVEENLANLERLVAIIREHRPEAKIIFTLSPIPLLATFRNIPAIPASTVSKAILRVAVDTLTTKHQDIYYWPAYEIVKEFCGNQYDADNRHPIVSTIETVIREFKRYYLAPVA